MHRRGNAGHRALLAAVTLIASAVVGGSMMAQTPVIDSAAAGRTLLPREVSVMAGTARVSVYRQGARPVNVRVETDSGTFVLSADSTIIARWADSAAALPDPPDTGEGAKVSFKMWQLRADGDSGAHMRFVRLPTNHGPELVLAMFNGAWNGVEYLGAQAPSVLAALRGDSTEPAKPARGRLVRPRDMKCDSTALAQILGIETANTSCTRAPVEQEATQRSHSPLPVYPPVLQHARVRGEATMAFVIDTTGHADPRTIQLFASTDYRFALACRAALPRMKFNPATVDGRKVRELVQLPFTFEMPRLTTIRFN